MLVAQWLMDWPKSHLNIGKTERVIDRVVAVHITAGSIPTMSLYFSHLRQDKLHFLAFPVKLKILPSPAIFGNRDVSAR